MICPVCDGFGSVSAADGYLLCYRPCSRCGGTGVAKLKVACVHGVNNGPYSHWFHDFEAAIPGAYAVRWPSTGTFTGDSFQFMREVHRQRWVSHVQHQLDQADVVVAHSMGTVLALQCEFDAPLVMIGSPLHHQILGPIMERRMERFRVDRVQSFWHDRDPITWGGRKIRVPSTKISVSGSGDQHRAELYLDHPFVQGAIREL